VTGRDRLSIVLLVVALVASVLELFFRPFGVALPALIVTMVAVTVSDRYRRLGLYTTAAITICFLIGSSFAVWDSRPLF